MQGCTVAVIGGGPAGVLCAAQFAKLGADVTVYERRTLAEQQDPGIGWSIALGGVACQSIEAAGLSSDFGPLKQCDFQVCNVWLEGLVLKHEAQSRACCRSHGITIQRGMAPPVYLGWEAAHSEKNTVSSYIITRLSIINHIRKQCKSQYGDRIKFADGFSLIAGNLAEGEAVFTQSQDTSHTDPADSIVGTGQNAGEVRVKADIIIAADGAGSRARQLVQNSDSKLRVRREYIQVSTEPFNLPKLDSAESIATLETPSGQPYLCVPQDPPHKITGSFAAFNYPVKSPEADPAIVSFMLGFRDAGNDFGGSVTCGTDWWKKERSSEEMLKLLEISFPHLPRVWLQKAADTCCKPQNLRTPSIIFCNKLGVGRCVFVGDAAHAVSPQLGVGCTSGLADSALLATLAETLHKNAAVELQSGNKTSSSLADIGKEWTKVRMRDARAYVQMSKSLNDMAYMNFHKNPLMLLKAAPEAVPMVLFKTRFPGRRFIDPGPKPSVALVNGGMTPSEVQNTFRYAFWKLVAGITGVAAVSGVAVASVAKLALRSRGSSST